MRIGYFFHMLKKKSRLYIFGGNGKVFLPVSFSFFGGNMEPTRIMIMKELGTGGFFFSPFFQY